MYSQLLSGLRREYDHLDRRRCLLLCSLQKFRRALRVQEVLKEG